MAHARRWMLLPTNSLAYANVAAIFFTSMALSVLNKDNEHRQQATMSSSNEEECSALRQLLSKLDIEPCFYPLISSACSHKESYLKDIETEDLQGKPDANGDVVPGAVARGLVRKLRRPAGGTSNGAASLDPVADTNDQSSTTDSPARLAFNEEEGAKSTIKPCSISIRRGAGDYRNFLCCSVRGQFQESRGSNSKVLTAILDNSASMRPQWPMVVDAITRVFTDQLLQNEEVSLILIVYNTDACEVDLPRTASELSSLLKDKYAPTGLTNFEKAFGKARDCIQRTIDFLRGRNKPASTIDVTTLLFTDGQDTSVPPLGYTSKAATNKARKAGDVFQNFLSSLQCRSHHTSIAAFGEHHDPAQCQYLSDRYYYINRPEVLSDWLSGGLAEMLESSGFCSVHASLPSSLSLAEPLPKTVRLEAGGYVALKIWLSSEEVNSRSNTVSSTEKVVVSVGDGKSNLVGSAALSSAGTVKPDCLEGRMFLLDWGELQLRQIALSLAGGRPSQTKLAMLRERLAGVKVLAQPVWDVANNPRACLRGRLLLLERMEELETRRKRLSYALGHFEDEGERGDTRKMGSVGIDAVLRDASQAVTNTAEKQLRRVEAAANLVPAEARSKSQFTHDVFSGKDAKQTADDGDALFYPVSNLSKTAKDDSIGLAIYRGENPISFDMFILLSNNGKKNVKDESGQAFSHIGIPVFDSPGHYARAKLVLTEVLRRLSPHGTYKKGTSELLLVDLLGKYLKLYLNERQTLTQQHAVEGMLHRARSVTAVFTSTTIDSSGKTLLDDALEEANSFLDCPERRSNAKDLYRTMALGMLVADKWPAQRFRNYGNAVLDESRNRAIAEGLSKLSDLEKLKLAYALLGPYDNRENWLDYHPLQDNSNKMLNLESFCFERAASELNRLEEQLPGAYSPRNPSLVSQVLASTLPSGTPPVVEWKALRSLISCWESVLEIGTSSGALWKMYDESMTNESASGSALLKFIRDSADLEPIATALRDALPGDPFQILHRIASGCIGSDGDEPGFNNWPLRLKLASKISSLVEQRARYARAHPIQGAAYPTRRGVSAKEMQLWWGSAAQPIDEQLYREVRRSIHGRHPHAKLILKEALTDKAYYKQGGHFEFSSPFDTFVPGLHRRTRDLHDAWVRKHQPTEGANSRERAVDEMLLKLRWDHRDERARVKLSKIVAQIWDGLEGITPCQPIPSALWIDDEDKTEKDKKDDESVPGFVFTTHQQSSARDNESVKTDWSLL